MIPSGGLPLQPSLDQKQLKMFLNWQGSKAVENIAVEEGDGQMEAAETELMGAVVELKAHEPIFGPLLSFVNTAPLMKNPLLNMPLKNDYRPDIPKPWENHCLAYF
jgi:hypothetical protein